MSACLNAAPAAQPRLLLLGTGTVGSAFVARYQALRQRQLALPSLEIVANSRIALACTDAPDAALAQARDAQGGDAEQRREIGRLHAGDISRSLRDHRAKEARNDARDRTSVEATSNLTGCDFL